MPELPEVETYRSFLEKTIQNKQIQKIVVLYDKLIKKPQPFKKKFNLILNSPVESIQRMGKYLLFFFEKNVLIVHLRMEGGFVFKAKKKLIPTYCLMYFVFTDESVLYYTDCRKFGTFELEDKDNFLKNKGLNKLGLEPFNLKLTSSYLALKWKNKKTNIKTTLLEQTVVVGIGNIYASEILFSAKINPFQSANTLTIKQLKKIIFNMRKILHQAILLGGTTSKTFKVDNHKGVYFEKLKVYGRKNKNCFICNEKIKWIKINGRGTFYCSVCQKKQKIKNKK